MQEISFRNDILPLKDKLYRLALRIIANPAEAEDIVQDTLLRVWNHRHEWQQFDSIEAYCLTVARNLALDRHRLGDTGLLSLDTDTETPVPDMQTPQRQMEDEERLHIVHRLIQALPERQRTILQLRDIEERTYKEIAAILGITEEQVKTNLFRARQRIKQQYSEIDKYGL